LPRGSNNKGKGRFGGRVKGTPNRVTVEKLEVARIAVEQAKGRNVKLGKEILEEFMMLFAGMAAQCQPIPEGMATPPGRTPDEPKFIEYATLAVKTAKDLADFQSPKFKAIMVSGAPGEDAPRLLPTGGDNVVTIHDAVALSRIYQRRIKAVR
jgi:hypothetical protein